jgi:hypothetical protein
MNTKTASPRPRKSKKARIGEPNLDPLTGESGAHPAGVGLGAAAGTVTGAVLGAAGGPVGIAIGSIVGGVAGGLAGKGMAESVDPTAEADFWRENHDRQIYAKGRGYNHFEPAYRTGVSGYAEGRTFEEREADLRRQYEEDISRDVEARRDDATMTQLEWEDAREASRAAYERIAKSRELRASDAPTTPLPRPPVA